VPHGTGRTSFEWHRLAESGASFVMEHAQRVHCWEPAEASFLRNNNCCQRPPKARDDARELHVDAVKVEATDAPKSAAGGMGGTVAVTATLAATGGAGAGVQQGLAALLMPGVAPQAPAHIFPQPVIPQVPLPPDQLLRLQQRQLQQQAQAAIQQQQQQQTQLLLLQQQAAQQATQNPHLAALHAQQQRQLILQQQQQQLFLLQMQQQQAVAPQAPPLEEGAALTAPAAPASLPTANPPPSQPLQPDSSMLIADGGDDFAALGEDELDRMLTDLMSDKSPEAWAVAGKESLPDPTAGLPMDLDAHLDALSAASTFSSDSPGGHANNWLTRPN